jgi:hypothetical protein
VANLSVPHPQAVKSFSREKTFNGHRATHVRRIKTVADPIDCSNVSWALGIILELLPDVGNEVIDGPSCVHLVTRKEGEQLLSTDRCAGVTEEEFKDSELR